MIPADLGAELALAVTAAATAGDLPAGAAKITPSGTWRPAPGGDPRGYATSLPFDLARLTGQQPVAVAEILARALRPTTWISTARPTGPGYLTITITPAALADVAVRTVRAGPACVRGDTLRGLERPAPPLPDLTAATTWRQAWREQTAAVAGRLAQAAGATTISALSPERWAPATHAPPASPAPAGPVADWVAYAGADAVRYGLTRSFAGRENDLRRGIGVTRDLADPFYVVSFAHADAASVLRWAADLRLSRTEPDERLAGLLGLPAELSLLAQLSWVAERVAGAARRHRPAQLARYLEQTARAWLDCRESCPALPFGGQAAPRDVAGISARLWLADASRAVLAAGLELAGVTPRDRL
jgi:arginyl-tRNA synthetase